ncbi:MAG TPA: hypothetical protein PL059_03765 [Spirochaetota bacterium]|nr:hypothetical protein [Spirochaetota bacterium]HOM09233.1 hypothetical protein [Spirochaetota bacterium]HPP49033.1 hypothetical protein [Spirochaetota bacterium]
MRAIISIIIFSIVVVMLLPLQNTLIAQRTKSSQSAGEQRKAEKGLKDNERFFYFINFSVSNVSVEEERIICRKAILYDMFAKFLYMKFKFKDSYENIRKTQELLISLYRMVLHREIDEGKKLLDTVSPGPILKDDYVSKHYCNLGYTNNEQSRMYMVMADSYRTTLYSMRLYKYIQALKKAKQAKRYALLAYIAFNHKDSNSRPENKQNVGNEPYIYSYMKTKLESVKDENEKNYMLKVLADSYYRLIDNYSFYDDVWSNGSLQELPEYADYQKEEE